MTYTILDTFLLLNHSIFKECSIKRKMIIQSEFRKKIILITILLFINLSLVYEIIPDQKVVDPNLISTFDSEPLKYLNTADNQVLIQSVPMHYQINDYYCGPAALEMILDYYGPDITQDEIAEVARTYEPNSGTFCDDMRRAGHFSEISLSRGREIPGGLIGYTLRQIGYASFEIYLNNITCLRELIDLGYPILIITWSSEAHDGKHFRVVTGYNHQNGSIQNFILNDPWLGPNYVMDVNLFIDLWSAHTNWSLFVCPWNIKLEYPAKVEINSVFTITASIQYPCPIYFNPLDYPATSSKIIITLPNGLSLASYENEAKLLNDGVMHARDNATVKWNITAGSTNLEGLISIEACGKVSGSVADHGTMLKYSYTDKIGIEMQVPISVTGGIPTETGGYPTETVIIISLVSLGTAGSVIGVLLLRRKRIRKLN